MLIVLTIVARSSAFEYVGAIMCQHLVSSWIRIPAGSGCVGRVITNERSKSNPGQEEEASTTKARKVRQTHQKEWATAEQPPGEITARWMVRCWGGMV